MSINIQLSKYSVNLIVTLTINKRVCMNVLQATRISAPLSITHKSFSNRSSSFRLSLSHRVLHFFFLHFFFLSQSMFSYPRAYNKRILPCVSAPLALHCTQQRPRVVVSSFHSFFRSIVLPYTCTVMITRERGEKMKEEKKKPNKLTSGMEWSEEKRRKKNKTHTTYSTYTSVVHLKKK